MKVIFKAPSQGDAENGKVLVESQSYVLAELLPLCNSFQPRVLSAGQFEIEVDADLLFQGIDPDGTFTEMLVKPSGSRDSVFKGFARTTTSEFVPGNVYLVPMAGLTEVEPTLMVPGSLWASWDGSIDASMSARTALYLPESRKTPLFSTSVDVIQCSFDMGQYVAIQKAKGVRKQSDGISLVQNLANKF